MSRLAKKLCQSANCSENIADINEIDEDLYDDNEGGIHLDDDIFIPPPQRVIQADTRHGLPRLIITHIVNENFKSYFGKVVIGPFHKSFSCVVGPNGSGKSNVIDSVMFVFGVKAFKLRCKDMRSFIHKSNNHKNIDKATVEIYFIQIQDTESGHYTIVPNSRFKISRTVTANGLSFYKIDNRKVVYKDIIKHLRLFGIDLLYNRFLILQGEVEKISLMKPKKVNETGQPGMLEYVEDIIGTTRYKEPLRKLNEKLRMLQEKRRVQLELTKRLKGELNMMREPMQVVVNYLTTKNEITQLSNQKIQYLRLQVEREIEQKQNLKRELENALKENEETANELDNQRTELDKELKQTRKNTDKLMEKCETERSTKNQMQRTLEDLEKHFSDLEAQKDRLLENHAHAQTELEQLQKAIDENKAKIVVNDKVLTEIMEEINKADENLKIAETGYLTEVQAFEDAKNKYVDMLNRANTKYMELNNLHISAMFEYNNIKNARDQEFSRISQLEIKYSSNTRELESKQKDLQKFSTENEMRLNDIKQFEEQLSYHENEYRDKQIKLENLNTKVSEQKNMRNSLNMSSRVLKYLLDRKSDGTVPGVIGRLGDLGAIDKKYDVAITMSCNFLDFVVVDTSQTSATCINLLKRDNVGQSGFISLDRLQNFSAFIMNKPNVLDAERLFDLIKIPDQKVRPAFYSVLRDTLVVNNINIASKISYGTKRYRVVTLIGDIVEMDGSMTGGGKTPPRSGKMGAAVRIPTEDANKLKEELDELKNSVKSITYEKAKYINLIESHKKTLLETSKIIQHLEVDTQRLSKEIPELNMEIVSLKKKLDKSVPDQAVLNEKHEKLTSAQKDLKDAENEVNNLKKKISDTDKRIHDTRDRVMKNPEMILNQLEEKERSISSENKIFDNEIRKCERKINELRNKVRVKDEIMGNIQKKKNTIELEKSELTIRLENLIKKLQEYEEHLRISTNAVEQLQTDLREINSKYNSILREKSNKEKEKDTIVAQLRNLQHDVRDLTNQFASLKLEIVPDISIPWNRAPSEVNGDDNSQNSDNTIRLYSVQDIEMFNLGRLSSVIRQKTEYLNTLKPSLSTIGTFVDTRKKTLEEHEKLQNITEKCNQYSEWHDETKRKRISEFKEGFAVIARKIKTLYQMLTFGGDADLELKDSLNPFSEGIELSVRPPKKSWKTIEKLSGGEKTLASLTIVFALHDYRPTPFYFMDEIDAALDDVNSCVIGHYIKRKTRMAQFIVISLRLPMFTISPRLIGIFKIDDCTDSIAVRNDAHDRGRSATDTQAAETNEDGHNYYQTAFV